MLVLHVQSALRWHVKRATIYIIPIQFEWIFNHLWLTSGLKETNVYYIADLGQPVSLLTSGKFIIT